MPAATTAFTCQHAAALRLHPSHNPLRSPRPRRLRSSSDSQQAPRLSAAPAEHTATSDWRAFRAHLRASSRVHQPSRHHADIAAAPSSDMAAAAAAHWAHALPRAEVGACLVSSRNAMWPASFAHLRRAVILLTSVSPTAGVSGLLFTRPTRFTVATHASVLARVGADFADNRVMLGGDCSTGSLDVVHPFSNGACSGAVDIMPGLARGGFNAARALVRERRADPSLFRFFVAHSKWSADSFDAEMCRGVWNVVACSPALLMSEDAALPDRLWQTLDAYT